MLLISVAAIPQTSLEALLAKVLQFVVKQLFKDLYKAFFDRFFKQNVYHLSSESVIVVPVVNYFWNVTKDADGISKSCHVKT